MKQWFKIFDSRTKELIVAQNFEDAKNKFKDMVENNKSHVIEFYKGYHNTPLGRCIILDYYAGLRDGRSTIDTEELMDVDLTGKWL